MAYLGGGSGHAAAGARPMGSTTPAEGGASVWSIGRKAPPVSDLPGEPEGDLDWERIGIFAAGIAVGAFVGASIMFFSAPVSGPMARQAVRRRARKALWRGRDAWEDLRDELAAATLSKKKALRRRRRGARAAWAERLPD